MRHSDTTTHDAEIVGRFTRLLDLSNQERERVEKLIREDPRTFFATLSLGLQLREVVSGARNVRGRLVQLRLRSDRVRVNRSSSEEERERDVVALMDQLSTQLAKSRRTPADLPGSESGTSPRRERTEHGGSDQGGGLSDPHERLPAPALEVPEHLRDLVVTPQKNNTERDPALISAAEAARLLRVDRQTVYNWIEHGKMLGWRYRTKQRINVPKDQILGPGAVVEGIEDILQIIERPELAWEFLYTLHSFDDGVMRPIDKLRAGDTSAVLDAARGYGMTMGD